MEFGRSYWPSSSHLKNKNYQIQFQLKLWESTKTYVKSQNCSESGSNVLCFLEYVFPLEFPIHTSNNKTKMITVKSWWIIIKRLTVAVICQDVSWTVLQNIESIKCSFVYQINSADGQLYKYLKSHWSGQQPTQSQSRRFRVVETPLVSFYVSFPCCCRARWLMPEFDVTQGYNHLPWSRDEFLEDNLDFELSPARTNPSN